MESKDWVFSARGRLTADVGYVARYCQNIPVNGYYQTLTTIQSEQLPHANIRA